MASITTARRAPFRVAHMASSRCLARHVSSTTSSSSQSTLQSTIMPPPSLVTRLTRPFTQTIPYLFSAHMNALDLFVKHRKSGHKISSRTELRFYMDVKNDYKCLITTGPWLMIPLVGRLVKKILYKRAWEGVPGFVRREDLESFTMNVVAHREATREEVLSALSQKFKGAEGPLAKRWSKIIQEGHSSPQALLTLLPLFASHASLLDFTESEARVLCRFLGLGILPFKSKERLFQWGDWILKDDEMLRSENVRRLTYPDIIEALVERGAIDLSSSDQVLRQALGAYLKNVGTLRQAIKRTVRATTQQIKPNSELTPEQVCAMVPIMVVGQCLRALEGVEGRA
ncbi:hypothetical protein HDU85_004781 [Gaertneriomyces sp. JEL0708]|nr:hypothetical protein HDU85_004781 [Gaertneriomyces sp. JEL0708]